MKTKKLFKINHSYRIFLLILTAFLFTNASASVNKIMSSEGDEEVARYLLIWDKEGGCVSFALEEHPRVTVDVADGLVNCVTTKQEIAFPIKDVHKYTLDANEGPSSGIADISEEEGQLRNHEGSLFFYNYKPGTSVGIYNLNGVVVSINNINNDGTLSISTQNLNAGIYLIKAGKITYKFTKR